MKNYLYYLFDADGTLIDTMELIYKSYCHTLESYKGLKVTREEIIKGIGIPLRPQLEKYLGKKSDEEFSKIYSDHNTYQLSIAPRFLKLFPGVKPVLQGLKKRGKRCAIVTSRTLPSLTIYFKTLDIFDFFEYFITPEKTKKHKPAPDPVLEALRLFKADPHDALMIGDTVFDMKSASSAGVDSCFVTWNHNEIDEQDTMPMYTINRMEELLNL